jgi:hypothetical protein
MHAGVFTVYVRAHVPMCKLHVRDELRDTYESFSMLSACFTVVEMKSAKLCAMHTIE